MGRLSYQDHRFLEAALNWRIENLSLSNFTEIISDLTKIVLVPDLTEFKEVGISLIFLEDTF